MKDSDPIFTYELNNDSVVAMIKINSQSQGGALEMIPGLGGLGELGWNPQEMMNDPRNQQAMNAVLNNLQTLNQSLNSPELRLLFQQNL